MHVICKELVIFRGIKTVRYSATNKQSIEVDLLHNWHISYNSKHTLANGIIP